MKKPSSPINLTYVALLRGINVGGNKKVQMAELEKTLENLGLKNVRTLLASGNVIFEAKLEKTAEFLKNLSTALEKKFKFSIPLILIPFSEIENIIKLEPFRKIKLTPDTRLYVTFLTEKSKSKLPLPHYSPDNSFQILSSNSIAIFSVLDLSKTKTPDVMNILEKEFGKNITTRNWNTVMKIKAGI